LNIYFEENRLIWDHPHVFLQNACRQKVISQKVFSQNVFGQNVSWNHNYDKIEKKNFNNFNSKNECGKNARFSCPFCSERKISLPSVVIRLERKRKKRLISRDYELGYKF